MTEHKGTSFYHSCVKVPVDPCSRQPTPSYERPSMISKSARRSGTDSTGRSGRKINFVSRDQLITESESSSNHGSSESFLEFLDSIPDYGQVHHLSNEQFKQKLDYLKRKQRLFSLNLKNHQSQEDYVDTNKHDTLRSASSNDYNHSKIKTQWQKDKDDNGSLRLNGRKCCFEESRTNSPLLFPSGTFAGLAEDQDLLTYRCKDKESKTLRNKQILNSTNKSWSTWSESKSEENGESDEADDSIETKSLPPNSSREWHPTVPKPFSFTLREDAEKYMDFTEKEIRRDSSQDRNKKTFTKKRRVRPIPLTSKIPMYDRLIAEKEARSRLIREESALNLMSQVKPFKLECDKRAWRSLTRSSPEIRSYKNLSSNWRFKAKPIPKNLFGTQVYDRMLEDEYYRQLLKKIRAAELMKSSSLPPSMARRERVRSTCAYFENRRMKEDGVNNNNSTMNSSLRLSCSTPMISERSRSAMTVLPSRGNNLAAVLRCQASRLENLDFDCREKMEREMREKMEEERREQSIKIREALIGRKPAWRALRSAARHEHERDLNIRTSMRRDEAREQTERHRLQMEMMLDRVTQIPALFERHSQISQTKMPSIFRGSRKKKKKKIKRSNSNSTESYGSFGSDSRPNSASLTSSSAGTVISSAHRSLKSYESRESEKSDNKSDNSNSKKKGIRGPLKVSINETAELIEDPNQKENEYLSDDNRQHHDIDNDSS